MKYKINCINNLVDRAVLLSDRKFHCENLKTIKEILSNNNFPDYVINKYIKKRLYVLNNNTENNNNEAINNRKNIDVGAFITLPYIGKLSDNISRFLNKKGLRVVYRLQKKLSILIKRGKDATSKMNRTNVIYKLQCNDCSVSYIGQTKRHLSTRIKEHQNNIKKHESSHSVVSKHRTNCNHDFRWLDPCILHTEKNTRKREIAEMFYIKRQTNKINLQTDTDNLSSVYDKVIRMA